MPYVREGREEDEGMTEHEKSKVGGRYGGEVYKEKKLQLFILLYVYLKMGVSLGQV